MDMVTIVTKVGGKALIQGGAFRLDKGPTQAEVNAFRAAAKVYGKCLAEGKMVGIGCIVNDLALKPEERPKATGNVQLPEEYLEILQEAHIELPDLRIWYESTLRNKVKKDVKKGRAGEGGIKENEGKGIGVAVCAGIMGRFYSELADEGYTQQIGFYAWEHEPFDPRDKVCPLGPHRGALPQFSGYVLRINVVNFWVYPEGGINLACDEKPGGGHE